MKANLKPEATPWIIPDVSIRLQPSPAVPRIRLVSVGMPVPDNRVAISAVVSGPLPTTPETLMASPASLRTAVPYAYEMRTLENAQHPRQFGAFQQPTRGGLSRKALARAFSFIEENLGENFTLDDLARAACISRFHFARMFRISTGESPMGFCLQRRVERAKELLIQGETRISEIAHALGFFDQSHLSRTFRRLTGISPGEFARLYAEKD